MRTALNIRWAVLSIGLMLVAGIASAQSQGVSTSAADLHYRAGVELMRSEKWSEAADEFRGAIAADPSMVLAHYNLGQCRMAERRYVEAAAAYKAAKNAYTDLNNLGQKESAAHQRDLQNEIRDLRDAIDQLHLLKDGSGQRREQEINARIQLLEGMQYKDGRPPTMPAEFPLALGSAYFRQQKMDEALVEYQEAVRINPKLGAAHNNLAVIHLLAGRPKEAESELNAARKNGFHINPQLEADIKKAKASS